MVVRSSRRTGRTRRSSASAKVPATGKTNDGRDPTRRSLKTAENVQTGEDFARLMNAVMYDVLSGALSPGEANAVVSAGRQTLRIVEMTLRFAQFSPTVPLITGGRRATRS